MIDSCIQAIDRDSLPQVIAYDAENFGTQREKLLRAYHQNAPEYSFAAIKSGRIAGYCLGRHGSHFEQIGPLMADHFSLARALFEKAAGRAAGKPVIIDILSAQAFWRAYLLDKGFSVQRPFVRMHLGEWPVQRDRLRQFAIAGPEFG